MSISSSDAAFLTECNFKRKAIKKEQTVYVAATTLLLTCTVVFWAMPLCNLVCGYQCFREMPLPPAYPEEEPVHVPSKLSPTH
jgi:hypothetical protein